MPVSADLLARIEELRTQTSEVWLWSLAHDVFADDRFKAFALAARLPSRPLRREFFLAQAYQLTGDTRWVNDANRMMARAPNAGLPERDTALIIAELKAPEKAILPPFLLPWL